MVDVDILELTSARHIFTCFQRHGGPEQSQCSFQLKFPSVSRMILLRFLYLGDIPSTVIDGHCKDEKTDGRLQDNCKACLNTQGPQICVCVCVCFCQFWSQFTGSEANSKRFAS